MTFTAISRYRDVKAITSPIVLPPIRPATMQKVQNDQDRMIAGMGLA